MVSGDLQIQLKPAEYASRECVDSDDEFEGVSQAASSYDSHISFENVDQLYQTEQVRRIGGSPLQSTESVSDEVMNTQPVDDPGNNTHRRPKRMKSPDVKKAYLFMNSKVERNSVTASSRSTPTRKYLTPQWKSKSATVDDDPNSNR